MPVRSVLAAVAIAALLVNVARAQQQQQAPAAAPAPAGDAAKGKALFMADGCYECHGTVGQGGRATGPKIALTQLPMDAFLQQLRQPSNEMPPYEAGVVSDADAADIRAYLQSLPAPVQASAVPLLNQ